MRRVQLLVFLLAWLTFGYFHQGGGWNQNGRFALTRALVEGRKPWIDDFLVYAPRGEKGSPGLRRIPVENGVFADAGRTFALVWSTKGTARTPLSPDAPKDARPAPADWAAVTGDLAFARGHVHPNKAPGVSFAAVPAYAAIFGAERALGVDADSAYVLSVNAWLAGVFSVGLLSALGVVVFFRLALRLADGDLRRALFATAAFGFGTIYLPYATMLYEHDAAAALLLAAFALAFTPDKPKRVIAAGFCAGAAIVTSYLSVIAAAVVLGYLMWRTRRLRSVLGFLAGAALPLLVLAAYNDACFGTVFTTNYAWENPLFRQSSGHLGGLFTAPRPDVLAALLISPFRGLFTGSPVLALGVAGLVSMLQKSRWRREGIVCAAMIAHVLLFNLSFENWNGGWGCGPRYLIPALPFLALPIALPSAWPRGIGGALLAISIAGMSVATVVDAQPPAASSATWAVSPVWSIDLPQFVTGRPGAYATASWPDEFLARRMEPVSVNPGGIYEAADDRFYAADSLEAKWSSFNAGEILFPGSRLSVLPWLAAASALLVFLRRARSRS